MSLINCLCHFVVKDVASAREKLYAGDRVQFQVSVHKPSKNRHATNIKLLERAVKQTDKGVVTFVKKTDGRPKYGFIEVGFILFVVATRMLLSFFFVAKKKRSWVNCYSSCLISNLLPTN